MPATHTMNIARLSLPQRLLMSVVRAYRYFLSPWLGSACRFEPTCSAYSLQAIETHGAGAGAYLTLHRLARCHPWCEGGYDPAPATPPALFKFFSAAAPEHSGAAPSPLSDKTSP